MRFLKSSAVILLFAHIPSLRDPELCYLMVATAKAAFDPHIPHELLLVCKHKVQQSTSPYWLLCHLDQEVVTDTLKESPGLIMPCCAGPPADRGNNTYPSVYLRGAQTINSINLKI